MTAFSQVPQIEPGVSQELAKWRAARYSDVRYKLNLTLEKMSPVLKGTMEIRLKVDEKRSGGVEETGTQAPSPANAGSSGVTALSEPGAIATGLAVSNPTPIILDWRKIRGSENLSTITNVSINGRSIDLPVLHGQELTSLLRRPPSFDYLELNEHLIFSEGVVAGENVIKLDFTSPILTSGSAITRYVDKEDGAEYIYSLFVPSDASTAFPVFDQPDLKARFTLTIDSPKDWEAVSNTDAFVSSSSERSDKNPRSVFSFQETAPISSYVFSFATGSFTPFVEDAADFKQQTVPMPKEMNLGDLLGKPRNKTIIYVRKSQAAKFKPHAAEVFRLNREGIKYLETYFDYKFPFPKYDLVLIPEFPFGGMEHAGATFLRESSVIFPQEPTKNDYISRANLIFHEAAHQWFGDTVTMKWFDDLWLKEGFAEFMAYKTLEKVQGGNPTGREGAPRSQNAGQMPEVNAWKVFYERNKQAAYLTDSTKGTTPIYQEIANLNSAKSAYGNIVYRKAPSFLRQAEFYLGPDIFQTAVRAFLKKHEYANAGWEDLVKEFEGASGNNLSAWANIWVKQQGLPTFRLCIGDYSRSVKFTGHPGEINLLFSQSGFPCDPVSNRTGNRPIWPEALQFYYILADGKTRIEKVTLGKNDREIEEIWGYNFGGRESKQTKTNLAAPKFVFPNYQDYGYGIFLLDDKSRDYVLKNIQNEKDPFLRSMMWGSLWDSVREGELDPKEYVELVIKVLSSGFSRPTAGKMPPEGGTPSESDESTIATLLSRVSTAMNYYLPDVGGNASVNERAKSSTTVSDKPTPQDDNRGTLVDTRVSARLETLLIERMQNAPTLGLRITYYRALLTIVSSENARSVLKEMLKGGNLSGSEGALRPIAASTGTLPTGRVSASIPLRTKDKFDIVTKLLILGDAEAPKLLDDLIKTETSDEAKRYAYAAKAGIATAENKAKYWADFTANKEIPESWIEAAFGPFNSVRHSERTLPYLERALKELPNHKRNRKIFFVNGWLGSFIGGQRSEEALNIVNKFLADNPTLDKDLRLKILENVDLIERAVKIRAKYKKF